MGSVSVPASQVGSSARNGVNSRTWASFRRPPSHCTRADQMERAASGSARYSVTSSFSFPRFTSFRLAIISLINVVLSFGDSSASSALQSRLSIPRLFTRLSVLITNLQDGGEDLVKTRCALLQPTSDLMPPRSAIAGVRVSPKAQAVDARPGCRPTGWRDKQSPRSGESDRLG